jgi:hypothetical protein
MLSAQLKKSLVYSFKSFTCLNFYQLITKTKTKTKLLNRVLGQRFGGYGLGYGYGGYGRGYYYG